jgi:hypothetical protein
VEFHAGFRKAEKEVLILCRGVKGDNARLKTLLAPAPTAVHSLRGSMPLRESRDGLAGAA